MMPRRTQGRLRRLTNTDRVKKALHRQRTGALTGTEKLESKSARKVLSRNRRFNA